MSNQIQLSSELLNNIFEAISKHDQAVEKDLMVGLQYLSAIIGYFAAEYPGTDADRNELLEQLAVFSVQVADDRVQSMQQQQQQQQQSQAPQANMPKGKSAATDDPAVGIWKPE